MAAAEHHGTRGASRGREDSAVPVAGGAGGAGGDVPGAGSGGAVPVADVLGELPAVPVVRLRRAEVAKFRSLKTDSCRGR